jgi:hypothetical protein
MAEGGLPMGFYMMEEWEGGGEMMAEGKEKKSISRADHKKKE